MVYLYFIFSIYFILIFFFFFFFFFNDTATTEIYTLSLHDAFRSREPLRSPISRRIWRQPPSASAPTSSWLSRSEEHTSELQSHLNLVCRLLLEKKKKKKKKKKKTKTKKKKKKKKTKKKK